MRKPYQVREVKALSRKQQVKEKPESSRALVYMDICDITDKDELEWSHEKINGECVLRVKVVKGKK